MLWKSLKQQKWGNSPSGIKALGKTGVAEWNAATKLKKLPKQKGVKLSNLLKKKY